MPEIIIKKLPVYNKKFGEEPCAYALVDVDLYELLESLGPWRLVRSLSRRKRLPYARVLLDNNSALSLHQTVVLLTEERFGSSKDMIIALIKARDSENLRECVKMIPSIIVADRNRLNCTKGNLWLDEKKVGLQEELLGCNLNSEPMTDWGETVKSEDESLRQALDKEERLMRESFREQGMSPKEIDEAIVVNKELTAKALSQELVEDQTVSTRERVSPANDPLPTGMARPEDKLKSTRLPDFITRRKLKEPWYEGEDSGGPTTKE